MHLKNIPGYDWNLAQLAENIGNLDYDALAELFDSLQKKFEKDAVHDLSRWDPQVATLLQNIGNWIKDILEKDVEPLANLCRPYNQKI